MWEFNYKLLTICQKLLRISIPLKETESFEKEVDNQSLANQTSDKRNIISPKKPAIFAHKTYYQIFGNKFENSATPNDNSNDSLQDNLTINFENNLSILDLLFNEGTNALSIIK